MLQTAQPAVYDINLAQIPAAVMVAVVERYRQALHTWAEPRHSNKLSPPWPWQIVVYLLQQGTLRLVVTYNRFRVKTDRTMGANAGPNTAAIHRYRSLDAHECSHLAAKQPSEDGNLKQVILRMRA